MNLGLINDTQNYILANNALERWLIALGVALALAIALWLIRMLGRRLAKRELKQRFVRKIPGIFKKQLEQFDDVHFDRAHFKAYGAYSLDFEFVYYVHTADYNRYMDIQQAINLGLYEDFEKEDIEFAYPTQTLFLERDESQ